VEYKIADNIEDMLHAINEGEAHIAAAGLTRTEVCCSENGNASFKSG
jgi:spore coat polysaccharide biosynthesis predicted glycosyltransferase SpsG